MGDISVIPLVDEGLGNSAYLLDWTRDAHWRWMPAVICARYGRPRNGVG